MNFSYLGQNNAASLITKKTQSTNYSALKTFLGWET